MPRQPLELRVDRLEDKVSELAGLPARVEELGAQISHLRVEMRAEFSAIRGEGGEALARLRNELLAKLEDQIAGIRGEGAEGVTLAAMRDELRQQIHDGDEETRRLMRVLHEDLVGRIALIKEGRSRRKKSDRDPR